MRLELDTAARALDVNLNEQQLDRLLAYLDILRKWNNRYNLVGTSDQAELVQKHLLDSIAITPYIKDAPILDVGSGAGLPGIPLAITLPALAFTLLDANSKKTRFMRQVAIELNLSNIEITQSRVEDLQIANMPKTVIARAFAPLRKALNLLARVCAPQGQVLIMLGERTPELPTTDRFKTITTHAIHVPGLSAQRHLLVADKE